MKLSLFFSFLAVAGAFVAIGCDSKDSPESEQAPIDRAVESDSKVAGPSDKAPEPPALRVELEKGDRISLLGNALA